MAEIGLEGLKSKKSGNMGLKRRCFGALGFFF